MADLDYTSLECVSPILTKQFLTSHLTQWFGRPLQFTRWGYEGEAAKGDSFMSDLIRIKIFGKDANDKEEDIQIILKTIPKNKGRRLTFRLEEFFKNEVNFYRHVLPELLKFQAKKNIEDPFEEYARVFIAYTDGDNDALALEDVSVLNYSKPIRQEGIDYEHCKVVLRTFAKYHAISFAMKDQKPENFAKLRTQVSEVIYRPDLWSWYEKFWARLCGIAIDAVEKEYPNSIYLEKVKELASPATYPRMCKVVSDEEYAIINHGDSWTNNFLFKYENSKPVDAKMIDFQLVRCSSPVVDLSFFVYACTTQDLRNVYYETMLKYYHSELAKRIRQLGSDPEKLYSWDMFMGDVKKNFFFGLALSFESNPFIVLDPEDAPNMEMKGEEKMNINDIFTVQPLKTQKARLREADCVVHGVDNGYI